MSPCGYFDLSRNRKRNEPTLYLLYRLFAYTNPSSLFTFPLPFFLVGGREDQTPARFPNFEVSSTLTLAELRKTPYIHRMTDDGI